MTRIEIESSILKAVKAEVSEWMSIESEIDNAYDYETKAVETGMRIVRHMLEQSQGRMPKSRNLKKN